MSINLEKLDLKPALKIVNGSGKVKVVMTSCPECHFSINAEKFFDDLDTTRHLLFMPLTTIPSAIPIIQTILSDRDPVAKYKQIIKDSINYYASGNYNFMQFLKDKGHTIGTNDKEIMKTIEKMNENVREVGFKRTPSFIVDGQLYVNTSQELKDKILELMKG